ncbi:uncharacterized protein LOC129792192 [Lutzomyia longipalpis]|uniref:uncharacterized protein LOC129792192 n=1 Tax=Lutzomyia longipalpis TaxID=7200 RepID=UPI002483B537|nr:uncharacterized protein LOC129792192 [Lutzomyia longipalpis]
MVLLRTLLLLVVCSYALATVVPAGSIPQAVIVGGLLKAAAIKSAALKVAALKAAAIKGLAIKHFVVPAVMKHYKENRGKYEEIGHKLEAGVHKIEAGVQKFFGRGQEEHSVQGYGSYEHEEPKHEVYYHKESPKWEQHSYGYSHGSAYQEGHIHNHHVPHYSYKYGVDDYHSGDHKTAWESRFGDHVKGEYTIKEPDGTKRIVSYHADPKGGFVADVKKVGAPHWGSHSHYVSHRIGYSAPESTEESDDSYEGYETEED